MTKIISLVCFKCGIIATSGKISCCGRGGSWFGNCGVAGKTTFDHKWSEGFEACKARSKSKTVIGQHSYREQESNSVFNDADRIHSKTTSIAASKFTSRPLNVSTPMRDRAAVTVPPNSPNSTLMKMSTTTSTRMPVDIPAVVSVPAHTMSIKASTSTLFNRVSTIALSRNSMINTSNKVLRNASVHTTAITSIPAQGCGLWSVGSHIIIIVTVAVLI